MKKILMIFSLIAICNNSFCSETIANNHLSTKKEDRFKIRSHKKLLNLKANNDHPKKIRSWIIAYAAGQKVDLKNRSYINDPKIGNHSYYLGYRFNSLATGLIINGGSGIFFRAYFLDNFYFNFESTATENQDNLFGSSTSSNIIGFGYELQFSDIISLTPRISYYRIKDGYFFYEEFELNGLLLNLGLQINLGKNRKRKSF